MWLAMGKVAVASILISFVSCPSGKKVGLAGFLTALPLTTLLALAFYHVEWGDSKQSVEYAKSVFIAFAHSCCRIRAITPMVERVLNHLGDGT
jgi:hypothetical protein